ncbi:MAG: hypothetical protein M1166_02510 [Candidatus Thermoplasmatota archaeon]|jgi:hypothetical protein|nr:hypothetical protein [Candidatus Thermoplasmatota archaeon]
MVDYKELYNTIVSKWKEMESWPDEKKTEGDALDIKLLFGSDEMTISLERNDVERHIEDKREETKTDKYMKERYKAEGDSYLYPFYLYREGLAFYSQCSLIELSVDFLKHIDSFEVETWND